MLAAWRLISGRYTAFLLTGLIFVSVLFLALEHCPGRLPVFSPLIYPSLSVFLLSFHILIGCFMVMRYACDKNQHFILPIACSFTTSIFLLSWSLFSFPAWFDTGTRQSIDYNHVMLLMTCRYTFTSLMFLLSGWLYSKQKILSRYPGTDGVITVVLLIAFVMCATLCLQSKPIIQALGLVFIDNTTHIYQPLWSHGILFGLLALWFFTTVYLIAVTRLRTLFWFSICVVSISYLCTLILLLAGQQAESYSWYYARVFEVISGLLLIIGLLWDVFTLYHMTRQQYTISWQNSIRDPLTRLYNRSYFYDVLTQSLPLCNGQTPLSVVVCDLDHFKRINDNYGHLKGDEVLRHVAQVFMRHIRSNDIAGRIGGEEFALLLHDTHMHEAFHIAEDIRRDLARYRPILGNTMNKEKITISMGIYTAAHSQDDAELCVANADYAMYQAKAQGRNQVICFRPAETAPAI